MTTTISGVLATIEAWRWPIISACFSAAAFFLILHVQIVRPWRRRRKLKRPFDAYFLITSRNRFQLNYVVQDENKEHFVKEIVVPPKSEIPIQIILHPRLGFLQREIYFGCEESDANEEKPRATEYFAPFVAKGARRSAQPDEAHPGHYTDYNGFYHVREDYLYTKDARVIGFKLETRATGTYRAQIYVVTDDVRGKAELSIKVIERPEITRMRCVMKKHRKCFVIPTRANEP